MNLNQTLAHGLSILLLYDSTKMCLTVADISKQLKFSQSKTYRMVRTLLKYNFLQEKRGTAQYCLGLNALRIGLLVQQNLEVPRVAKPLMKELSALTKETVLLTAVRGTKAMCLEKVESEQAVRYSIFQPGADLPLHAGASTKILMAFLPEEEWDRIIREEGLKRYTPKTITKVSHLKSVLREIRLKGYALSAQEVDRDVIAVGAPILNGSGEAVAGLSIAGPAYRINDKKLSRFRRLVVEYSQRISSKLGYSSKTASGNHSYQRPQIVR